MVNGFIEHLYAPLGTMLNWSATANIHNSQIITTLTKPFSSLLWFQQPFPSNGFQQWRFFSFPLSLHYCPANIQQLNSQLHFPNSHLKLRNSTAASELNLIYNHCARTE
jgi:hypothetical protein